MKMLLNSRSISTTILILVISLMKLSAQNLEARIDSMIQEVFTNAEDPGGAFLVSKKGKLVYHKAFGKANLELGVEMQNNFVFQIGSMTKQFTAISIMMLESKGSLKVTDAVSKYISDFPNGENITIHHLLTHTSGIMNYTKMGGISEIAIKEMSPKMLVDFFKNEAIDFLPGERFLYNNSGYVVLGYIIELVSGKAYQDFIEQEIFQKLDMSQSYYASDKKVIKNRVDGYHLKSGIFENKTTINYSIPYAAGSLMSTTEDLLKWQNAINNYTLINAETTKKVFANYTLNNGEHINYGYGWHIKSLEGLESREHGGSIFGFKSMGVYVPSEDLYVIGLSNCDCHSPTKLVGDIAKAFLINSIKN